MSHSFFCYFAEATLGIVLMILWSSESAVAQNYEVADIDCAVGTGGKNFELLTAKLKKPDGFRGFPIFADDRGSNVKDSVNQDLLKNAPCQIFPDTSDTVGRVFILRITDFSQCGVLKRNGFIHVRVWFPQLPGVVMLSDQEVIIMCKPPQPTITQSKAAGFAGSIPNGYGITHNDFDIPSGARVSGIVEESPGRLEYEVALFRETGTPSSAGRSSPGAGAYITGVDSHELPVDQAVPIGTRLQLRARINPDSAWQHAKLMEVSVSPDPKDGSAEGSVALIKDGCRNPDLASIIPKQPYRYKDRSNEVVLDFEAFLLSNMGERNTLWLHTQIKACMEAQDCNPEFCMDVYQPSGYGKRRKRFATEGIDSGPTTVMTMAVTTNSSTEYSSPLAQHWTAYLSSGSSSTPKASGLNETDKIGLELSRHHIYPLPDPPPSTDFGKMSFNNLEFPNQNEEIISRLDEHRKSKAASDNRKDKEDGSTKFGDNIGFSVVMPADYYRKSEVVSKPYECRGWATATMCALMGALVAGAMSCVMSYKLKKYSSYKEKSLYQIHSSNAQTPIPVRTKDTTVTLEQGKGGVSKSNGHRHHHHHKYARDSSVYRP